MADIRARQAMGAQSPPPERPSGVTLIALYEFATAAILLLMSCAILFFAMPALMFTATTPAGVVRALVVLLFLLGCGLAFAGASAVVGWGLFKMWPGRASERWYWRSQPCSASRSGPSPGSSC